jgi:hypothetical protein
LRLFDGIEDLAAQELLLQGLVKPLHLAGRRRTPRCSEQVADPVFPTDPVEKYEARAFSEATGEDFAVEFLRDVKRLRL